MAAFTQHAAFGFWKGSLVLGRPKTAGAMGQFGRLTKDADLPSKKVLAGYIRKATALNDQGVKGRALETSGRRQPRRSGRG